MSHYLKEIEADIEQQAERVSEIGEFISQVEQIARLKKELKAAYDSRSHYKLRYEALAADRLATRSDMASQLIRARLNGDKSLSCQAIADKCFFSVGTIYTMTYRLKQSKRG